jgi:RNA polymerase sigma-70 factor (ECF subfamily)
MAEVEQDIIRRVLQGDRSAVQEFYGLYVSSMYAFAFYRVGRNEALAEEAATEIFHYAITHLREYDPARGEVYSWLVNVGRRVVTELLRRERRWRRHEIAWHRVDEKILSIYAAMDSKSIPDEILECRETRHLVGAAMSQLPQKYRNLLEERYWKGRSTSELSRLLAISEKAVESLLARAREAFRETLLVVAREVGVAGLEEGS